TRWLCHLPGEVEDGLRVLTRHLRRPVAAGGHLRHPSVHGVQPVSHGRLPHRSHRDLRGVVTYGGDLDDGRLLRLDTRFARGGGLDRRLFYGGRVRTDRPAELTPGRTIHRDLFVPPRLERLPHCSRLPEIVCEFHASLRTAELLPAVYIRLNTGHREHD